MRYVLIAVALLSVNTAFTQPDRAFVEEALKTVQRIQSATYLAQHTASAPGDTVAFKTLRHVEREFFNAKDRTIGSTFVWFIESSTDTTHINFFYDGNAKAHFDWNKKIVNVDSFRNNRYSFRPVGPPFFNYIKSILKYALETKDDVKLTVHHYQDSVEVRLLIPDELVDFFGNDIMYGDRKVLGYLGSDFKSSYAIWFRKSDLLPYRVNRKVGGSKNFYRISNVMVNRHRIENFSPVSYIPKDFVVRTVQATASQSRKLITDLIGTRAPDWAMKDANGNTVSLNDLKKKVLVLQFTGIGCGPCHQSMPFLKTWASESSNGNFEIIGIETWSKNEEGIKRYFEKNAINYTFLKANESVARDYRIYSVPVFFILDENRIIRQVISGYESEQTDAKLRNAVKALL